MAASPSHTSGAPGGAIGAFVAVVRMVSRLCGIVAALLIVASVGVTCQLIFMRFVLNESTIWQTEAVTYMMIAATLLGLPYVQLLRGHVNVDLVPMLLPPAARKALAALVALATLVVAAIMIFYGTELWHMSLERGWRSDTVWGVKLWIPYLAVPVGFAFYALQLVADLVSPGDEPGVPPQEMDAGEDVAIHAPDSHKADPDTPVRTSPGEERR